MSDDESISNSSQPPALEDADLDDVSSGASIVSDSSASVSIGTDDDLSDDESDNDDGHPLKQDDVNGHGGLGTAFVVPLKTGSDDEMESPGTTGRPRGRRALNDRQNALERNALRRQASNDMLAAMRAAAAPGASEEPNTGHDNAPRRRPPPRTKSGAVTEGGEENGDIPRRRPPPRTKSGEGMPGVVGSPTHPRRAPPRTKSGEGMMLRRDPSGPGNLGDSTVDFDMSMPIHENPEDDDGADVDYSLMSPSGQRRFLRRDREEALSRNAVRRQASSDMLRAMRDAAAAGRTPPSRAKSSAAALQRQPPPRTKSGEGLVPADDGEGEERLKPEPRRRPPPRTKSGDALQGGEATASARRPPSRTKSGGVFAPPSVPTILE